MSYVRFSGFKLEVVPEGISCDMRFGVFPWEDSVHNEVAERVCMTVACLCVKQIIEHATQQHDHVELDFYSEVAERGCMTVAGFCATQDIEHVPQRHDHGELDF